MRNFLLEHLYEAIQPNGRLKDNNIAKRLFFMLCGEEKYRSNLFDLKQEDIEKLKNKISGFSPSDNDPNIYKTYQPEKPKPKDLRLIKLFIRGVRKFKSPGYPGDSPKLFHSLGFCDKNEEACSAIFIGGNGIGKTSIFNSLEYILLNRIPSAEMKNVNDFSDFLQNKNKPKVMWEIGLDMMSEWRYVTSEGNEKPSYVSETELLATPALFCFQGDVERLEKEWSIGEYLYDQLGLGFYYQLIKIIDDNIKEEEIVWNECRDLSKELEENREQIDAISILPQKKSPKDKIKLSRTDKDFKKEILSELPKDDVVFRRYLGLRIERVKAYLEVDNNVIKRFLSSELRYVHTNLIELCGRLYKLIPKETTSEENVAELNREWGILCDAFKTYDDVKNRIIDRSIDLYKVSQLKGFRYFKKKSLIEKAKIKESFLVERINKGPLSFNTYNNFGFFPPEYLSQWKSQIQQLLDYLKEKLGIIMSDYHERILKPVVEPLVGIYFKDLGEVDLTFDNLRLLLRIRLKEAEENADPEFINKILNTFRMKVFTMSLKCALACCMMRMYDVRLPLIVDDIFDSSDFSHRADIDRYFRTLLLKYKELMPEYPFQLVFFTQDELIAEGVEKGIIGTFGKDSVNLSRLTNPDYNDCLKDDLYVSTVTGDKIRHRSLAVSFPNKLGIRIRR